MNARTSYTLVGLFVLGLGAAFVGVILWLGSGSAGRHYDTYLVYTTESVSGLSRDGAVKYRGVDVGRIRDIGLDPGNPERVRLLLEIQQGTPIKQDTVATLEVRGLTGLAYVNLVGGSRQAPPLKPVGDGIPVIPSRPSLWGRLDHKLGLVLENLIDASRELKDWLSEDNRKLLFNTLDHLEKLSAMLLGQSGTVRTALGDLAGTLHNTRQATQGLPALVERMQGAASALERMAGTFDRTARSLDATVAARDRDLRRFTANALPEAGAMISDLRQAAANLRRLSEALRRDPGILLRGSPAGTPGPGEEGAAHQ